MEENESLAVKALVEANGLLRDTLAHQRRTIRILRAVISKLRMQQAIAHANDEEFKAACVGEIYEHDEASGGFPDASSS